MLKLTRPRGPTIYIAASAIALIEPDGLGGSMLRLIGCSGNEQVSESPDQIVAMPEMVMLANPMMMIDRSG